MNIANNNMAMPACIATVSNSQKIIEFFFYKYFPSFNTICNDKSCNNIVMTSIYIKIIKQIVLLHTTTYTLCGLIQHTWAKGFYHMHTYTQSLHIHANTQIYTCAHIDTHTHTNTYACKHTHTYTKACVHARMHTYACTRTSTHTHTHTHTHAL